MFNFLVTGMEITSPRGSFLMSRDRVFLYTDSDLTVRFAPNGVLDETALMLLPSIFTRETTPYDESPVMARIGRITKIRKTPRDYSIEYELDPSVLPISNNILISLAASLHFEINPKVFGDFRTNHWAIKDVDLFRVLFTQNIGQIKPKVFKLPDQGIKNNLVTVMMPFSAEFNDVYQTLQTTVASMNMTCARADDIWQEQMIIQDIVKLISTAKVVICDLTGKNSNVFYETGIADTLGKDVILIAQHDSDIPFDLRHIRALKYLNNEEGLIELSQKISTRIGTLIN